MIRPVAGHDDAWTVQLQYVRDGRKAKAQVGNVSPHMMGAYHCQLCPPATHAGVYCDDVFNMANAFTVVLLVSDLRI